MGLVKRTYVDGETVITADNLNDIQDEIIVNGLNIGKHSDSLADEYDSTAVYDVGDYCMHENVLYKCNTAITTIEVWNASHWTAVTVGDELAQADWDEADNTKPDYIKNKPSIPVIDATLSTQGQAADAKATGDKITEAEQIMSYLETGNTASRNYSAGEYVNWKGVLYTVNTGGISSGASFVAGSGGNLSAVGDGGGLNSLKNTLSVLDDEIPDTVQTITFDQNGNVQSITHSRNNVAVRTDVFTFAANSVTEVRTLSTGQSLTIVTNLSTLETTITYSEGGN